MVKRVVAAIGFGACFGAFALLGCSHTVTGSDGSKVTVDAGGKTEVTDAKGNKATITEGDKKVVIESDNGKSQYVAENGTVKAHDDKGNSVAIGTGVTEAQLGVPFYPGSTDTKDSVVATSDKGGTVLSVRETSDDAAKVLAFYTAKLGKPTSSLNSDAMTMATWKSGKKEQMLSISKDGASNKVSITVATDK